MDPTHTHTHIYPITTSPVCEPLTATSLLQGSCPLSLSRRGHLDKTLCFLLDVATWLLRIYCFHPRAAPAQDTGDKNLV